MNKTENTLAPALASLFLAVPILCSLAVLVVATIKLCQWILQ